MGLDNPIHLLILLVIVLLVFGAKRLPEMGRSLGEGMRGFKDGISGSSQPDPHQTISQQAPPPQADTGQTQTAEQTKTGLES